jgi:nucleoside-diphosphate-sugar epimerase
MDVEMLPCDVTDPTQVREAMEGVDAVVHCAVGADAVVIDGTGHVLQAAKDAGVNRVVHLSTIDVYGKVEGVVAEDRPRLITGQAYGNAKGRAEELCEEFIRNGLPVVILRPSFVYGPFSANWTLMYAERMRSGRWFLPPQYCLGACNAVYVDDVVQAIWLALTKDEAVGQAFNVNGDPGPTWQEYFTCLNDGLGLPPLESTGVAHSRLRAAAMLPARKIAKYLITNHRDAVMRLAQRSLLLKNAMRRAEGIIRQTPAPNEFEVYSRTTVYDISRAREVLGFEPAFSMEEGVALSAAWLRHNGYGPANGAGEPA